MSMVSSFLMFILLGSFCLPKQGFGHPTPYYHKAPPTVLSSTDQSWALQVPLLDTEKI